MLMWIRYGRDSAAQHRILSTLLLLMMQGKLLYTTSSRPVIAVVHPGHAATNRGNVRCAATNEADNLYKGIPLAKGIIERRLMDKQVTCLA